MTRIKLNHFGEHCEEIPPSAPSTNEEPSLFTIFDIDTTLDVIFLRQNSNFILFCEYEIYPDLKQQLFFIMSIFIIIHKISESKQISNSILFHHCIINIKIKKEL